MTAKDAIKSVFNSNFYFINEYLKDLSDADLLVRPLPGANHAAWQLGHLIVAETWLLGNITNAPTAELPAGFAEKHAKETASADSTAGYHTKAEYLALWKKVRELTFAKLDKLPDADLDNPNEGRMAQFAPTLGALFLLAANHQMMHGGQFAVLRRKLGKPIVI